MSSNPITTTTTVGGSVGGNGGGLQAGTVTITSSGTAISNTLPYYYPGIPNGTISHESRCGSLSGGKLKSGCRRSDASSPYQQYWTGVAMTGATTPYGLGGLAGQIVQWSPQSPNQLAQAQINNPAGTALGNMLGGGNTQP